MRTLLITAGALLFVAATGFGQEQSAINERMRSNQERMRGSNVPVEEQQNLTLGRQVQFTQVRQDTLEMNQLIQSINVDVANLQKGVVAADLNKKLKRLEKLAKGMRQAVE
jgi:predicted Rossmann fold nucleotide-binding protein DprA/Smf involved in DNA uptake